MPDVPRPEHPRPDFQRDDWANLNGPWEFAFDPGNIGEQARWYAATGTPTASGDLAADPFDAEITVPFPWESPLSGIADHDYLGAAWYRRIVEAPSSWADAGDTARWRLHPVLRFGAVDWHARVWIDGRFVAEHAGGYSPFEIDLSPYMRPGRPATLVVRAWDVCDAATPLGKQTIRWYHHSSGIWQTVWLEGRPDASIEDIAIRPDVAEGMAFFDVEVDTSRVRRGRRYALRVTSTDGTFPAASREVVSGLERDIVTLEVQPVQPKAWSPEVPHLYDCVVSLSPVDSNDETDSETDRVKTYFGLRSVSRGRWEGRPYEYVLLNGEPVYLRGALDQAFHPDGLHSYPSDETIRGDIEAAKAMGLNMLRCHIKVNDPRYYYWADRLGLLIMYDLPCTVITTPSARSAWEATMRDAIRRDRSHPSIFAWVLFNETWGLQEHGTPDGWAWVRAMMDAARRLDPTRLVEDNSPCLYDHVDTDINSWHFYLDDYATARRHIERVVAETYEGSAFNYVSGRDGTGGRFPLYPNAEAFRQTTAPLMNSEYASLSARQGDRDIAYGLKYLTSELRRHEKIGGYVYTELTDIEWEHNGLLNYDRTKKEFGYEALMSGMGLPDLLGADFAGFDGPPCQTLHSGDDLRLPIFAAQWDRRPIDDGKVRWRATVIDRFGDVRPLAEGEAPLVPRRYGVVDAGVAELRLPDSPSLVTVACWIDDGDGGIRARNYVNVDVFDGALPPPVEQTATGYVLRPRLTSVAATSWTSPVIGTDGRKFGAEGAGWVEYVVALPARLDARSVASMRVRFEAGARTARRRIGWPDPRYVLPTDYPQTEERKLPTELTVSIQGVHVGTITLPDDPADARGVLSLHLSPDWETGSYGYLTTLELPQTQAQAAVQAEGDGQLRVRFEVPPGDRCGGLNVYGERMGAYPLAPTIFIAIR